MYGDFEYEYEVEAGKEGILFFGPKGSGKTSAAYLLPGTKLALSFDGKSLRAKETMRPDDKDITVLNARKYVTAFKTKMTEAGRKTIDYAVWLLNETRKRGGADWVIIDGLDILIEAAEMAMRHDHRVGPFDTFANLSWWKDRKLNIRLVHEAAFGCAKVGVAFTTYVEKDEIVNNATLVSKKDVPKWMDIVMYDTDAVIKTDQEDDRFLLRVVSSKIKRYRTGDVLDVTNVRRLEDAKPTGQLRPEEKVDLAKAQRRRKTRQAIRACPSCGGEVTTEMSVLHCSKCDWVHEDEDD